MRLHSASLGLVLIVISCGSPLFPAACPAVMVPRSPKCDFLRRGRSAFTRVEPCRSRLSNTEFNALVKELVRLGKKGSEELSKYLSSKKPLLSDLQIHDLLLIAEACQYNQLRAAIEKVYRTTAIPRTCRFSHDAEPIASSSTGADTDPEGAISF